MFSSGDGTAGSQKRARLLRRAAAGSSPKALLAAAVAVSSFRLDFDRKGQDEVQRARMKRRGTLLLPTIKILSFAIICTKNSRFVA